MSERIIHISEYDKKRLRNVLIEAEHSNYRGSEYLKNLANELERAEVLSPKEIPPDVITMNTKVCLIDTDTGDEMTYTLVFPEDADLSQDKISVLAPVGTAMLGYHVGDTFEWEVPAGKCKYKVKEIFYQPEASGDYDL